MFVFSSKDFHTCNLAVVIFTYCTQFMSVLLIKSHSPQDGLHRYAVWLDNYNKLHKQSNQPLAGFFLFIQKSICRAAGRNLLCSTAHTSSCTNLHTCVSRNSPLKYWWTSLRETQVTVIPFEGFWLIIPVLRQTHQCQSSPGLAGSLSLTARGLELLNRTESISVTLCSLREGMTNWHCRRWSWTSVELQELHFPTLKLCSRRGLVTGQQTATGFPSMQWQICHTALWCRVDLFCRACSCCCHFVFNEVLVHPALYYTCANQVPSFLNRMYPAEDTEKSFSLKYELEDYWTLLLQGNYHPNPTVKKIKVSIYLMWFQVQLFS